MSAATDTLTAQADTLERLMWEAMDDLQSAADVVRDLSAERDRLEAEIRVLKGQHRAISKEIDAGLDQLTKQERLVHQLRERKPRPTLVSRGQRRKPAMSSRPPFNSTPPIVAESTT